MQNIRNLDLKSYAILSLLVLWASTTFSIALMEISFVCALAFWILFRFREKGTGTFLGIGSVFLQGGQAPFPSEKEPVPGKTVPVPFQKGASPRIDWALWAPLALFFILVLASYFTSEYPKQSFRGIFKIAKPLLVFFMAADLFRDEKSSMRFDLAFLLTFLLVTIDSSTQYAFGKDLLRGFPAQDSSAGLRLVGPFGDFGRMSAYLILAFPVFALRFWSEFRRPDRKKKSLYILALAIVAFTLLYLTRCRAPVLALVFSLGCLLIYKQWFKALGIGLVLFLTLLAFTPRGMIIHLDADSKEQSFIERIELSKRALDVIEAKPWLGTGINTYNVAHDKYDKEQNWRVRGYYAHNGYLQLAAEIGLPGIFFFVLFLVMFFVRGLRATKAVRGSPGELEQLGILTGLLAFLLYALADTNLQSPQSLMSFWCLAGFLLAKQNQKWGYPQGDSPSKSIKGTVPLEQPA